MLRVGHGVIVRPGDRVADRFEIESVAGTGGMGRVYRARDAVTGEPVALKMLAGDTTRFEREAELLRALDHPAIVRYVAHGTFEERPFIAMEWLDGHDLAKRLANDGLSLPDCLVVGERIAQALGAAHARGIVHRDVKPSNIWLAGGDPERAMLIDFGIARATDLTRQTQTGAALGTPGYMAPEQARGQGNIGPPADIYSLGCVLYRALTGHPAFGGDHVVAVLAKILFEPAPRLTDRLDQVPLDLDDLVASMMAKDPADRPPDGNAVAALLTRMRARLDDLPPSRRHELRSPTIGEREQRLVALVVAGQVPDVSAGLRESVAAQGGRLERLVDGSLVALIEGVGPATDQAAHAARCALSLHEALPRIPVALAMGQIEIDGSVSIDELIDRAATLALDRGQQHGVRLDAATAGLIDARFEVETAEGTSWLRGERADTTPIRTLLGKETPCVGRERELATLEGILAEAIAEEAPRATLVIAPPGTGKSRLAREAAARMKASHPGLQVWMSRADPARMRSPFAMLAPLVEKRTGARVKALLDELGRATDHRPDVHVLADRMRTAWEDFVEAETAAGPVLVVCEDIHWGDAPSMAFLDSAMRVVSHHAWMVLALARPEVDDRFPGLWAERGVVRITLQELSRRASEKLVDVVLGALPAETRERIVVRAAGNAFYLEELIRAVAEGSEELPETVLAMMQSRIAGLDAKARRMLRAASILGETFWRGALAALLGPDAGAEALDGLVRRELVSRSNPSRFRGEDQYVFRHAVVRDAAYATLVESDRALGHALAAKWLVKNGEHEAAVIAAHFEAGGDPANAVDWFRRAAEQALSANDFAGAIDAAKRAAACGAGGELLGAVELVSAEAHWWRADNEEAERAAGAAFALYPEGSDGWFEAAGQLARSAGTKGESERLAEIAERIDASIARGNAGRAPLAVSAHTALHLSHLGNVALARRLLDRVALSAPEHDSLLRGWVERTEAHLALLECDPAAYLDRCVASFEAFEDALSLRDAVIAEIDVAYAYDCVGDHEEAERRLREALVRTDRLGMVPTVHGTRHQLAIVLARQGRLDEARELAAQARHGLREVRDERMEGGARLVLASIAHRAGDPATAERELREALAAMAPHWHPWRVYATALLGALCLERGALDDASVHARTAMDHVGAAGIEADAFVRLVHARVLDARGDHDAAREVLATSARRILARAERFEPEMRATFLERVEDNVATLALANAWGIPVTASAAAAP